MLYSAMFLMESHKADTGTAQKPSESLLQQRTLCSETMMQAATSLSAYKNFFWQRGVADEAVVLIPCRYAYYLLERCTGVQSRKVLCGDIAMQMIAKTIEPDDAPVTPIVASLMDLMHSHEHMAALVAEICGKLCDSDKLALELLREYGRLDGSGDTKANGIKNVAPFITDLSTLQPLCVLQQLPHLLPHFQSEAYNFRSALVNAIANIIEYIHSAVIQQNEINGDDSSASRNHSPMDFSKTRDQLLDFLFERVYDTSSFTRSTVLKAWITLAVNRMLPKERTVSVTVMAMDRLNDKTVLVRKQAMQVRMCSVHFRHY